MPELDPRARPPIDPSSINGRLTDRAIELLGALNQITGYQGIGTDTYTLLANGELNDAMLALHTIKANSDAPHWQEDERIYFQASPQRLEEISKQIIDNVDEIQLDILGNINNLFDILDGKSENEFDPLEQALRDATNFDEIINSGNDLNSLLDVDQIAQDIINIYFTSFQLNGLDSRINDNIFNLLDDKDGVYSNGTTDEPKFFVTFPKRDVSIRRIYNRVVEELRAEYEAENGEGTWNQEVYLSEMLATNQLILERDVILAIKADKGLSDEDVRGLTEKDFLDFLGADINGDGEIDISEKLEDLIRIADAEYRHNDDRDRTLEKLFKAHLSEYTKPAVLVDSSNGALFTKIAIGQLRTVYEDQFGVWEGEDYTYGSETINVDFDALDKNLRTLFDKNELKLNNDLINLIIEDRNISEEELEDYKKSTDFLQLISYKKLTDLAAEYYGTEDEKELMLKLFEDDISINTPKYYEDQRSVYDIITGRDSSAANADNLNRIFSSLEDQIKGIGDSTYDLFSFGFDKLPRNNLQAYLRNNPLEAIRFLEEQRESQETRDDKERLDEQIDKLVARLQRVIGSSIENANRKILDSEKRILELEAFVDDDSTSELDRNVALAEISRLQNLVDEQTQMAEDVQPVLELVNRYEFGNLEILDQISQATSEHFDFSEMPEVSLEQIYAELDEDATFYNAHKALYASELIESNKINARSYGKKLPSPRADGSIPEDTAPIAPHIGPTPTSAVIAAIGNQMLSSAQRLLDKNDIPDENWLNNQSDFLTAFNDALAGIDEGSSTFGEMFVQALKDAALPIVKQFLESKSGLQEAADDIRDDLIHNHSILNLSLIMAQSDPDQNLDEMNVSFALREIGFDLSELADPSSVDVSDNFISEVGLENTKVFLENIVNADKNTNFALQIEAKQSQKAVKEALLDSATDPQVIADLEAEIAQLEAEISNLQERRNNYNDSVSLLYGSGNETNPESGSILERFNTFSAEIAANTNGKPEGMSDVEYLSQEENRLQDEYKDALEAYSNSLTNFDEDNDGVIDVETEFKKAIEETDLDFDGNGVNDFKDIKDIAHTLYGGANSLASTIETSFGAQEQKTVIDPITGKERSGIRHQDFRRLVLLMFLFSILEAGEWDYRRQEADVTRYAVF